MRKAALLKPVLLILTVTFLFSCSSDGDERREEYLDATYFERLELPPDLTRPDQSNNALKIPSPTERALSEFKEEGALNAVVTPTFKGIELKSENGLFWLEINQNADKLWLKLVSFWENEGIVVKRAEPLLGYMETDWIKNLSNDREAGFFEKLMANIDPGRKDRFRLRVESVNNNRSTKLFIAHSGIELFVEANDDYAEDDETIHWQGRPHESDLEREMLYRLSLYLGVPESQADKIFEHYKPYQRRVTLSEDNLATFIMTGSMQYVWSSVYRALGRLDINVIKENKKARTLEIEIVLIGEEALGGEVDEYARDSWVMQLFSGSNRDKMTGIDSDRVFVLHFNASKNNVSVAIKSKDGKEEVDFLAEELRKALALKLY